MNKATAIVGGLVVVGTVAGIAIAMGGGDTPPKVRPPYTKRVVPPQTPAEIEAVKQVFCTCFRGGATTQAPLVACALKQVYGEVPWPSRPGDDPSLAEVETRFASLAGQLIALPNAAARDAWCGSVGPQPDEPIPTPPPPVEPPQPPTVDPIDRIRDIASPLLSTTPKPGAFFIIEQGAGGIESTIKAALASVGIYNAKYQKVVLPAMQALSAGPRWNRPLYSRKKSTNPNTNEYWASNGRVINPAWLPRNDDARAALLNGRKPRRNINDSGNKTGAGSSYGLVWIPKFDAELAAQDVWSVRPADLDPPAELLDLLGM